MCGRCERTRRGAGHVSLYLYLLTTTISISLFTHNFFIERRTPSSGGIESLAWRRHIEPRSLMISQKLGKKNTSAPQPRKQIKKKIVRLPASSHTDLAKKHRPGALPGRWLACGRMLTAPPRGAGTGGASANAATGANKQKNGARQLPARRTNASPAVLAASAVGSGF